MVLCFSGSFALPLCISIQLSSPMPVFGPWQTLISRAAAAAGMISRRRFVQRAPSNPGSKHSLEQRALKRHPVVWGRRLLSAALQISARIKTPSCRSLFFSLSPPLFLSALLLLRIRHFHQCLTAASCSLRTLQSFLLVEWRSFAFVIKISAQFSSVYMFSFLC